MATEFKKYMHVEHIDNVISLIPNDDTIYIQPKLDGSNAQIFLKEDGSIGWGSRNHELNAEYDTLKMKEYIEANHDSLIKVITKLESDCNTPCILYGEWLVPHTIRNYEDSAWNKFYVFDVYLPEKRCYLHPHTYQPLLSYFYIDYVPGLCSLNIVEELSSNPSGIMQKLNEICEENTFLMKDGGIGEGIVIKDYSEGYQKQSIEKFGQVVWGKIVRADFKAKSKAKNKGEVEMTTEERIVFESLNKEFVSKEWHKLTSDEDVVWNDSMIPEFLGRVWFEWWKDYSFDAVAKKKLKVDTSLLRKEILKQTMKYLDVIRKEMRI